MQSPTNLFGKHELELKMSPRIPPVTPPYAPEIQQAFETIMPEGMPPLDIFRTLAHNPRVLEKMIAGSLLDKGCITLADRELIILRTCAMLGAEYEWGVHVAGFAHKASFSSKQIADTCNVQFAPSLWSPTQQLLIRLSDELRLHQHIGEALWRALEKHFSSDQLIELVMLSGLYHAVSFVVNAFGIANEPIAPRFPAASEASPEG